MDSRLTKKRKVDEDGRNFKSSRTMESFVIESSGQILCLICRETIAVHKEYNIKRHFTARHADKYESLVGQGSS